MNRILGAVIASLLVVALTQVAYADEGMWLPNQAPLAQIKLRYGFEPTPEWMEHLQKSAVRFSTGGSGSIISKDGLVMTNHHVGADLLLKLSTPERNLLNTGFNASSRSAELKCPELELDVLWSIEDVSAKIADASAAAGSDAAAAGAARRKAIAEIEAASMKSTGFKHEVVTLYQGARYHLYSYRTFRDVRLVFAPEESIAFFGGDTDNFEFPRFDLDCCFFRIYENDAPLKAEHFLSWSRDGAHDGELIFVWGHPGRTHRLFTYDHLRSMRDLDLPNRLARLWRTEVKLQGFMARNDEYARIGRDAYLGAQNGRKSATGLLDGLQDPKLMARKKSDEDRVRTKLAAKPGSLKRFDAARSRVTESLVAERATFARYQLIERGWRGTDYVGIARDIVRLATESPKANGDRLAEYGDAGRESLLTKLYSPAPIHAALEAEIIASQLARIAEQFGGDDALVVKLLAGKSPRDRARELVSNTTLNDPAARKALVEGGAAALASSNDAMLAFVAAMDDDARAARQRYENDVESVQRGAYADLAAARFEADGDSVYPDATFTLRMAFGTVKGYEEDGKAIAPFTTFAGLYQRAKERRGQVGFDLSPQWEASQSKLTLDTSMNFVCTADIIGGNSGSPVVNTFGEVVGLIFDGNLQSLVGDVLYDETRNRAVAVDSRAIVMALRVVYGADRLVAELTHAPR